MRIGLLLCDHVSPHLMEAAKVDYDRQFADLFAAADATTDMTTFDAIAGELPTDPAAADAWVITGSRHSVYDDEPWIHDLTACVAEFHRAAAPIIGVCFGHQMLAHALGGAVGRHDGDWGVGIRTVTFTEPTAGPPSTGTADLIFMHQDQVQTLPPGARVIGSAPHCEVAGLEVDGTAISVQAHPEWTTRYEAALMQDRIDRIGEAVVSDALSTLETGTHDGVPATRMMLEFARTAPQRRPG